MANIYLQSKIIKSRTTILSPKIKINSGPYTFKIFLEGNAYNHSVNINKLKFIYQINGVIKEKYIYLSTGHSLAEHKYVTNDGHQINKVKLTDIFLENNNDNIFYSLDNNFNDFALIAFNKLELDSTNYFNYNNKELLVKSVCQNFDIKILENNILIKNGCTTGSTQVIPVINFDTDTYIISKNGKYNYYTFKINGFIVIILTMYPQGIVVRGINNELSENLFNSNLKEFKNHQLLNKYNLTGEKYKYYKDNNCASLASLMGDSGSGFYRYIDNENIDFIGIHICSCSMIILSENINNNKIRIGKYTIEEVHKACQLLPINKIEKLICDNLPDNIKLIDIVS
jgi:hypothetical protein